MKVTYIGHAAMMVEANGTTVLMDPWMADPIYHGTWWHYPPLTLRVRDLPRLDYVYISHEHPDHFDPLTLRELDKGVPVLIPNFTRKGFRDRIASLGFKDIRELDFGTDVALDGSGLTVRLIAPDRAWDDSAILVRSPRLTLLNVNDCHLDDATLDMLGRTYAIDIAFLTFTGASQYPGCFEFPMDTKIERWRAPKHAHLAEFVNWAKRLRTARAVPAAGNYALLAPDQLFLNTGDYVNTPQEALDALAEAAPEIEGLQLNPGDTWSLTEGIRRAQPPPDWDRRMEHIEALSRENAGRIAEFFAAEPAAPPDLYERFREYFERAISANREAAARVGITTWWRVTGPQGGDWTLDFRRRHQWVSKGVPAGWNKRITIADTLVYLAVTEQTKWENVVLSFRVRLARNPDCYHQAFWTWIYTL